MIEVKVELFTGYCSKLGITKQQTNDLLADLQVELGAAEQLIEIFVEDTRRDLSEEGDHPALIAGMLGDLWRQVQVDHLFTDAKMEALLLKMQSQEKDARVVALQLKILSQE